MDQPSLEEMLAAYGVGRIGVSVRMAFLRKRPLAEVRQLLADLDFRAYLSPVATLRAPDGTLSFVRRNGTSTMESGDPEIAMVETYLNEDLGMVRVFPDGDPQGRLVPTLDPSAVKSVLYPGDGPALSREAFQVDDDTKAHRLGRFSLAATVLPLRRR